MKRFFVFVLACFFCLPLAVFAEGEVARRFYVEASVGEDGLYYADVCWDGAAYADDVGAVRFALSYPGEKLVCKSWKLGAALRQFQIKQGPQYTHSNPAVFVAVDIRGPVTGEGVLASFVFEPVEGAAGDAELSLELREVVTVTDAKEITEKFVSESLKLSLSESAGLPKLPCEEDASIHENLGWQKNPDQALEYIKQCPHCQTIVATKTANTETGDATVEGDTVFAPDTNLLPDGTEVKVETSQDKIPEDVLSGAAGVAGSDSLEQIGALDVTLTWQGDELVLSDRGTLTIPAPEGVQEGEVVWVCVVSAQGEKEYCRLECKDGKLTFSTAVFGKVYLLKDGEKAPEGVQGPTVEEPKDEPAEKPENTLPPVLWIVLGALVVAALAVTFVIRKKKKV